MGLNQDYPILDGIAPSWADVKATCAIYNGALIETKDIAAINTSRGVEVGYQKAPGGKRKRRTTGESTEEFSVTLYRYGYQKLIRALAAVAPQRGIQRAISLVHFDFQIQHTPELSDEIFERHVRGCRVIGDTMNGAEGVDADQVEVPMSCMQIVDIIDGLEIVLL